MEICAYCQEEILPHEQTEPFWHGEPQRMHEECWLRLIMGSVADQFGACDCLSGDDCDEPELTRREAARQAAAYFFTPARF